MDKLTQVKHNYLLIQLSLSSGNTVDMERKFYMSELGVTSGQLTDLELAWLKSKGATSSNLTDAWHQFMVSEGYIPEFSNLTDARYHYYIDNT